MRTNSKLIKLNALVEELFDFFELLSDIQVNQAYYIRHGIRDGLSKRNYYYKLKKFEKSGLIKRIKKDKKIAYELTARAKLLRDKALVKRQRTDGLATIIIFDIPEEKRRLRDSLRRFLLRNGYTQIQKSVFISPFEIFGDLVEFIKELGVVQNVTVMSGKIERYI